MNEPPIKPRTKGERLAYIAGYSNALVDAEKHGFRFGADQVAIMAESEGLVTREEIDAAKARHFHD